jgi:ribonuclease P protein component
MLPREDGEARVAFLTAKDVGRHVARNRLRRRLREACRTLWPEIANQPADLLFMGLPFGLTCDYRVLVEAMRGLLRKARVLSPEGAAGPGVSP